VIKSDQLLEIFDLHLISTVAMTATSVEVEPEPHKVFDTILTLDFG
jgi:hypothetical protein